MGFDGILGVFLDVYDCYIGVIVLYGNVIFFVEKKLRGFWVMRLLLVCLKNLLFLCLILIDSLL